MKPPRTDAERNALVEANLRLVFSLVGRCTRSDTPHADRDDCAQAGALALLRAAAAWDESRGTLATVAWVAIRREIYQELCRRDLIRVPQQRRGERRVKVAQLDEDAKHRQLADPAADADPDGPPGGRGGVPPDKVERTELVALALKAALPRQRMALRLRFWEGYTLREIAEVLGVNKQRAQQLVDEGIARARRALE
jgi:RNA polymerase sigma factor (sigma-70 family)